MTAWIFRNVLTVKIFLFYFHIYFYVLKSMLRQFMTISYNIMIFNGTKYLGNYTKCQWCVLKLMYMVRWRFIVYRKMQFFHSFAYSSIWCHLLYNSKLWCITKYFFSCIFLYGSFKLYIVYRLWFEMMHICTCTIIITKRIGKKLYVERISNYLFVLVERCIVDIL